MILYNIKLAIRSIVRSKLISGINILGLSLGITVCMLVFGFVNKEYSTDKYLPEFDNIYAILFDDHANISQPVVNIFNNRLSEVEEVTHYTHEWAPQVYLEDDAKNTFKLNYLMVADTAFFRVFQFKTLYGEPKKNLVGPNKIVLTQSLAQRIFGKSNPIGKTITYNSTYIQNELVEIVGVIEDLPHNSSWKFDAVLSMETDYKMKGFKANQTAWGNENFNAYLKTKEGADKTALEERLNKLFKEHAIENYKRFSIKIIPYRDVYFHQHDLSHQKHGNEFNVKIINTIGLLIFILAIFNFINLDTAQREKKLKTHGVIKLYGGKKNKMLRFFSTDSFLVVCAAFCLMLLLTTLILPYYNKLTESDYILLDFFKGWNLVFLTSIFLLTIIITNFVHTVLNRKHRILDLLRSNKNVKRKNYLRNSLLLIQFVLSIILITSIIAVQKQNYYVKNFDTGFELEKIIYANTNKTLSSKINAFKDKLSDLPEVSDITFSGETIGFIDQNWSLSINNRGERQQVSFAKTDVTENFFDFMGIEFLKGDAFRPDSHKRVEFIFNEAAFKEFNIKKLEDARVLISNDNSRGRIVGQTENFHFESVHSKIRPIGFMHSPDADKVVYIKIKSDQMKSMHTTIEKINAIWNELSPSFPFEFHFLDQSWEQLYKKEIQFTKILNLATIVSILLTCMGLIGLSFFVAENRTKEIGIRKTNGAKTHEINLMLNGDILKWVLIAFVISCPISYYAMDKWLENFAYRTELSWWIFALAGIIALGIALLTVSWQSWRAARRNPVESLRYE
ncbi:ABC transporter permease [Marinifilum caeruleilacunae]|uniref:ABC transporter permease n=1 Tax=Marinifilum caeruleilacunae TaxID=2499076 RepID=A0ABX1WSH5_9BACT|nr:ABC transporter permease [Marinifilum caeruleilacunae]NOU58868.1 ABC transporter permease [Marinifilum caeruleilacunae]